jgi:isochorismate pyruvate lyase
MPLSPEDCKAMPDVRAEIDRIDEALVDLMAERFKYVDRAWHLKDNPGQAYVGWRIQQVIDKVKDRGKAKGLPPELTEALWRQMIGWFVQYEEEKLRQAQETFATGHAPKGEGKA